jgi:hypothetical protein
MSDSDATPAVGSREMASVVVLDGREDEHAARVTAAIAAALAGESGPTDTPSAPAGGGAAVDRVISEADAAVVLDADSLAVAREAGVPFCVAVFPGFDLRFAGDLAAADRVVVAHESLVDEVVRRGALRGRIDVTGPVAPEGFAPCDDVAALRQDVGLPVDRPLVLVPTAALEEWGQQALFVQLSLVSPEVGFLFDVGRDAAAAEELRELVPLHGLTAWMFADGDVRESSRFWQAVDLVLARPRGYEVARALGVGVPLVLLPPGRSAAYAADALEATGAAEEADVIATLAVAVDAALEPETLGRARAASRALEASRAAARVAACVREAWAERSRATDREAARGLPHGLEALTGQERPESKARRDTDDIEARIDRELAELKKRL